MTALDRFSPSFRDDLLVNGLDVAAIVARVDPDVDLLGISCLFSHEWPVIRELIAALAARFPHVPIVCGGEHATAAPDVREALDLVADEEADDERLARALQRVDRG